MRLLVTLLGDDERVVHFIDRELGVLCEYDTRWATDYVATLRAFCQHAASKSAPAESRHISRAVLYDRLSKISRLLSVGLWAGMRRGRRLIRRRSLRATR
jgi:DNA-binding PucR family transcriptional regulator